MAEQLPNHRVYLVQDCGHGVRQPTSLYRCIDCERNFASRKEAERFHFELDVARRSRAAGGGE